MSGPNEKAAVQDGWCSEAPADSIPHRAFLSRVRSSVNDGLRGLDKAMAGFGQGLLEHVGCFLYVCGGRLPLTIGYREYRNRYVRKIIGDPEILKVFNTNQELPAGFGARFDERVVEYPWILSRLGRYRENLVALDAGSTLNYQDLLQHPAVKGLKWSIVTLAPETQCFWDLGVSYLYEDLRGLPWKDSWFDAITCISTIEHVGMDNVLVTMERAHRENRPEDFLDAVKEMRRVLKPGGVLFLTVPYGRYEHHGWFQQFDAGMLSALISGFQPAKIEKTFFHYTEKGWKLAPENECMDASFSDVIRNKHALRKDRVAGFPPDYAVAARAVACLELQK